MGSADEIPERDCQSAIHCGWRPDDSFFGVENAVRLLGASREVREDAVGRFSDEVAEILAQAPNAHLISFQDLCPFGPGTDPFRDPPDSAYMLHFRFDIMDAVHARVAAVLQDIGDAALSEG